jgi:RNA polymerase sigma-70 factor (ECF subfamily)
VTVLPPPGPRLDPVPGRSAPAGAPASPPAETPAGVQPGRDEVVKAAFRHRDALLSYAYGMLRNWSIAEDVVQESFLVVMNKWADVRAEDGVFLWVRRIVHFKTLEAIRSRGRETILPDEALMRLVEQSLDEHLDEELAERQRLIGLSLRECMAQLSDTSISLLAGFYWQQRSCETLAEEHHRSVNAVRLILSRLRDKLRLCLQRRFAHGGAGA